ncbi:protein phosphatase 1 regulatory subunit 12C isoform X2 [Monodelphis domestica]|uniref:protein phosphatase 1 regulatory subunit 12C isoform X2 n=1 Tax=Monodelphis domestica TaxID=13616 RepID=UPI0024E1D3AB|nr:protein phosphatase 1 regulatory subunit 12C isoform X2 [Monodelphis domestica]
MSGSVPESAAGAGAARERRQEQLRQWARAAGAGELAGGGGGRARARTVRFERAAEFLAACAGGDLEEARAMVRGGPGPGLLDSTNADGISALHQACIDENPEVVRFLVEEGASVNQADNEGWTPLHVAASCGYLDIAQYLLSHGADIAAVNSDGDLPLDLAEADAMESLLRAEVARRGVDVEAAKRAEEELLLRDTRCWLNGGAMPEARHPRTGASALHVAAAKGYMEVMRLLLQAGYDPELRDGDGWTPLHAAAHWGVEDACRLLAEHGGGMDSLTHAGQRPCDLADEDVLSLLEELTRKQEDLRNQKEAQNRGTEPSSEPQPVAGSKHRRSSVCRLSSREKISLQDLSKERKPGGAGAPPLRDDEESEEGPPEPGAFNGLATPQSPEAPGPKTKELRLARVPPTLSQKTGLAPDLTSEPPTPLPAMPAAPGPAASAPTDSRDRRRSYQMPVRDEESESQRKARSRLMRQSRRSTQGVTLTDLKEAEKSACRAWEPEKEAELSKGPDPAPRPRVPGLDHSDGPVQREEPEGDGLGRSAARDRRKVRKERRGPAEGEEAESGDPQASEESPASSLVDGSKRPRPPADPRDHPPDSSNFRKLYLSLEGENERLRESLQETTLRLAQLKVELERATQKQEQDADRPALLELERFERRALERKAAQLEEELKALSDLRADNQRLKDENSALIRVISKLSK